MFARPYTRQPASTPNEFDPIDVAHACNFPMTFTGKGYRCGIIELGGGFTTSDLGHYLGGSYSVTAVPVLDGSNSPDGPDGADGEVMLDIEVAASIAPDAEYRVYFAPNTGAGFIAAVDKACAECNVVTISWGGPESSWSASAMIAMDKAFAAARARGVVVFVASGDSGADDGTSQPVADFPASSPNVIACGGTRLTLDGAGHRASEVAWDDNDRTSASGGGMSRQFPGRQVPDIAGNADPQTGYKVLVDGERTVIGGTSAVAPLYAALALLLCEALGKPLGEAVDLSNAIATNPGVAFDVTAGSNGAYRAGPGRDNVTGWGVLDGAKLLAVLTDTVGDPAPVPPTTPAPVPSQWIRSWGDGNDFAALAAFAAARHSGSSLNREAADAWNRGK